MERAVVNEKPIANICGNSIASAKILDVIIERGNFIDVGKLEGYYQNIYDFEFRRIKSFEEVDIEVNEKSKGVLNAKCSTLKFILILEQLGIKEKKLYIVYNDLCKNNLKVFELFVLNIYFDKSFRNKMLARIDEIMQDGLEIRGSGYNEIFTNLSNRNQEIEDLSKLVPSYNNSEEPKEFFELVFLEIKKGIYNDFLKEYEEIKKALSLIRSH